MIKELVIQNMIHKRFLEILMASLIPVVIFGCSIPKSSYILIPPVGMSIEERAVVQRVCLVEATKLAGISLTEGDTCRIKDVDTSRFFEGGSGRSRSEYSDRYVLCFLNRNYQLLEQ